jgi:hypothetical protein
MRGFYSLNGTRCAEFSEFAGAIQSAKVNQAIQSGQQNVAGGATYLTAVDRTGATTVAQPGFVTGDPLWNGYATSKKLPTTADDMRRCPILVRAAIRTTCPGSTPASGTNPAVTIPANSAYPLLPAPLQSYNDGATTRCSVASEVNVELRVEQIYEVTGTPKMTTIDSILDARQALALQVSDMIRNKTAGNCPDGASVQSDGSCAFQ